MCSPTLLISRGVHFAGRPLLKEQGKTQTDGNRQKAQKKGILIGRGGIDAVNPTSGCPGQGGGGDNSPEVSQCQKESGQGGKFLFPKPGGLVLGRLNVIVSSLFPRFYHEFLDVILCFPVCSFDTLSRLDVQNMFDHEKNQFVIRKAKIKILIVGFFIGVVFVLFSGYLASQYVGWTEELRLSNLKQMVQLARNSIEPILWTDQKGVF